MITAFNRKELAITYDMKKDIGRKIQDMSMVSTYYGALEIYHDKE